VNPAAIEQLLRELWRERAVDELQSPALLLIAAQLGRIADALEDGIGRRQILSARERADASTS
jgi:hypothetical protein